MTNLPDNLKKSHEKRVEFHFEWGNFLQGGLALYLLAIFVLRAAIPVVIHIFPATEWLEITPTIAYIMIIFGVILLLMATGLTFSGDVGAALMLFQVPRGEKVRKPMSTATVSGNRFMANEQVKLMSKDMRTTLLALAHQNKKLEAIEYYRRETKTDPRLAADVVAQLLEFERRGLLENLD